MSYLLIHYPKCSTCQKAKRPLFIGEKHIAVGFNAAKWSEIR